MEFHPYSPDLFLPMTNDFAGEKFSSKEAFENRTSQFFSDIDEGLYGRDNEITFKMATSYRTKLTYLT